MPRAHVLPPAPVLEEMSASGMTHQQIADELTRRMGVTVKRSSVSAALCRAGKTKAKNRYHETLPWRIAPAHDDNYHARMLRALGRRDAGADLDARTNQKLETWLAARKSEGTVVAYSPDEGFTLVKAAGGEKYPIKEPA